VTFQYADFRNVGGAFFPFELRVYHNECLMEICTVLTMEVTDRFDEGLLRYRIPRDTHVMDSRFGPSLSYRQGDHEYTDQELARAALQLAQGKRPLLGRSAEASSAARQSPWFILPVFIVLPLLILAAARKAFKRPPLSVVLLAACGMAPWAIGAERTGAQPEAVDLGTRLLADLARNDGSRKAVFEVAVDGVPAPGVLPGARTRYSVAVLGRKLVAVYTNHWGRLAVAGHSGTETWHWSWGALEIIEDGEASFLPVDVLALRRFMAHEDVSLSLVAAPPTAVSPSAGAPRLMGTLTSPSCGLRFARYEVVLDPDAALMPRSFSAYAAADNQQLAYSISWDAYTTNGLERPLPTLITYSNVLARSVCILRLLNPKTAELPPHVIAPPKDGAILPLGNVAIAYDRVCELRGKNLQFYRWANGRRGQPLTMEQFIADDYR
jgi:hypothetical protein